MRGTRGRGARGREGWMRGREVQECRRTGRHVSKRDSERERRTSRWEWKG